MYLDESDDLFFADPVAFLRLAQTALLCCFTATPGDFVNGETRLLATCKVQVWEDPEHPAPRHKTTSITWEAVVTRLKTDLRAALVYCSDQQAQELVTAYPNRTKRDAGIYDALSSLDDKDQHWICVATNLEFMRAVDYRAPIKGLNLFVCRGFSNDRHVVQALGRVGRNGDPCDRLRLEGLLPTLIDEDQSTKHQAHVLESIAALAALPKSRPVDTLSKNLPLKRRTAKSDSPPAGAPPQKQPRLETKASNQSKLSFGIKKAPESVLPFPE